jgi:hypothetical protein
MKLRKKEKKEKVTKKEGAKEINRERWWTNKQ